MEKQHREGKFAEPKWFKGSPWKATNKDWSKRQGSDGSLWKGSKWSKLSWSKDDWGQQSQGEPNETRAESSGGDAWNQRRHPQDPYQQDAEVEHRMIEDYSIGTSMKLRG